MCNDFGNHIRYSDYLAAFSQTRIAGELGINPETARKYL